MVGHQRQMARLAAQMDGLGPNPEVMLGGLAESLKRGVRNDPRLTAEAKAKAMGQLSIDPGSSLGIAIAEVRGTTSIPVSGRMAEIGSGIRAVQSMAKLGGAVLSAVFGDPDAAAARTTLGLAAGTAGWTSLGISAFAQGLFADPDAGQALATLGVSAYVRGLLDDPDAGAARTTLGLAPGAPAWDALGIEAIVAGMIATGGAGTPYIATLLDDADAAAARATLGLPSGATGWTNFGISAFAQGLLDDADAATARATLGIAAGGGLPPGHLSGLTLSNSGTSTYFHIAAGRCRDDTDAIDIVLAAGIVGKRVAGPWAAGSGNVYGLDTGTRTINTWYSVWAIAKADGTADALFSLSATAPAMPPGFVYKRRIDLVRLAEALYAAIWSGGEPDLAAVEAELGLPAGRTALAAASASSSGTPTFRSAL